MYLCAEVYRISHTDFLRWSESDRAKAVAWEIRKRQTCPHCGTREEEWITGQRPYIPSKTECIGCRELEKANESIPNKVRGWTRAVLVRVTGGRQRES